MRSAVLALAAASVQMNGRRSDQTAQALTIFQSRHNLAQTGRLDGPTKQALGV